MHPGRGLAAKMHRVSFRHRPAEWIKRNTAANTLGRSALKLVREAENSFCPRDITRNNLAIFKIGVDSAEDIRLASLRNSDHYQLRSEAPGAFSRPVL